MDAKSSIFQQTKFHHSVQFCPSDNNKASATKDISDSHFISFCSATVWQRQRSVIKQEFTDHLVASSQLSQGPQKLHNQREALAFGFCLFLLLGQREV